MICLAYLSSSTMPIDAATLSDILAKSRRNNTANQVTGLLDATRLRHHVAQQEPSVRQQGSRSDAMRAR